MKRILPIFTALVGLTALAAAQSKPEPIVVKGNPPGHYPAPGASLLPLVGGSNDCSTAAVNDAISGVGMFAVNTVGATTGVAPQPVGFSTIKNDVWFYWTATVTGVARLETCNGVTVDSKAAAWTANNGTMCPSGTQLAYNDDACGLQTRITWDVTAGTPYFLQLGAFSEGTTYSGTFTLDILTPPTNDSCASPMAIAGAGPFAFDTLAATAGVEGQTEALCLSVGQTGIARDVWYVWTAGFTGTAGVSTCGNTLDTKVAVYPAGGCPTAGSALACNDDSCGTQAVTTFAATTGTSYLIQLGADPTNTTTGGTGMFAVADTSPPMNDNCATPISISGAGPFPFNNTNATTGTEGQNESLCLNAGTTAIRKDLWYTWTPSLSGPVTVSTCSLMTVPPGTSQDSKIAIYDGAGCPTMSAVVCNDDAACSASGLNATVMFNAVCGQVYTIQVGAYSSSSATNLIGAFSVAESGTACAPPSTPYCFGDGTGLACPCSNSGAAGNGCASSVNAAGGNLTSSGSASVSADTLALIGSGMPNSSALYFQGTSQLSGGLGVLFGDGLRCVGGSIIRLGTKNNTAGASQYPAPGDQSVSVRGFNSASDFRTYQIWYRNAAAFCTASTFNLTNGLSLTWAP